MKDKADDLMQKVIGRIEVERPKNGIKTVKPVVNTAPQEKNKMLRRTDKLSQYNKNERKLISRIYQIILQATDSETAESIISSIEAGLQ